MKTKKCTTCDLIKLHWSFGNLMQKQTIGVSFSNRSRINEQRCSRARSELQRFKEWPNTTQPETFKMPQTLNWIASIYTTFSVEALDVNLLRLFMVGIIASFTIRRWDVKYGLRTSTTDSNAVSAADGKTLRRARKNNAACFNNRRTLKGVFVVCAPLMSTFLGLALHVCIA